MTRAGDAVLVGGVRTPFGRFGGALRDLSALELCEIVVRACLERAGLPPASVDGVVAGHVLQDSPKSVYMAKHAGLAAGMPASITGMVVSRACGSGLQAVVSSAQSIALGEGSAYVAAGADCLSHVPYHLRGARFGLRLGSDGDTIVDPLFGPESAFVDSMTGAHMGGTAEKLAVQFGITREEADAFAARSHGRAREAMAGGSFAPDIVAVNGMDQDEGPRDSTLERLAALKPVFADGGICTAGNSSSLNDGGAAVGVVARATAEELDLRPRARIVSWGITGCDPSVMGIGPVDATKLALARAGLEIDDLDVIEVNEAFAAQVLAVGRALDWDADRVNPHGGAIALGHPLGASGVRLIIMLLRELEERDGRFGVATACIGGGQGISVVVERER